MSFAAEMTSHDTDLKPAVYKALGKEVNNAKPGGPWGSKRRFLRSALQPDADVKKPIPWLTERISSSSYENRFR